MVRSRNVIVALTGVVVVALVVALVLIFTGGSGSKTVVADFPSTIALYEGSDVKILGVKVGEVNTITPMGKTVRVQFSYDDKYDVPADAKAAVISPSIVGDRFIQLTPAYTGGPLLPDGAHLGVDRTATPLELDQIFGSLNQLDIALGPKGVNKPDESGTGALTRLLDSTARNFGGQGVQFNRTVRKLGELTKTLADNKDELFGSTRQVEKFIKALSRNDKTVRRFAESLASGSRLLASDRQELAAAVDNLGTALKAVRGFVHENRAALSRNIKGLRQVSDTIVKRRDALDEILTAAPAALNNLGLAYDPNTGTLDTRDAIGEIVTQLQIDPKGALCALLNLDGLTKGKVDCKFKQGVGRTAPFGEGTGGADNTRFDPTLAGLVGVKP